MTSLRSKYRANLRCGIFFLVLAAAVALYTTTIPISALQFGGMNSRSFPLIIAGIIALLSLCLIYQSVRGLKKAPAPTEEELAAEKNDRKRVLHVACAIVILAAYIYLIKPLGYVIATPLFLFALIMLVTPKEVRKPARIAIVCILTGVIVFIIFRYGFKVQLPLGILKYFG